MALLATPQLHPEDPVGVSVIGVEFDSDGVVGISVVGSAISVAVSVISDVGSVVSVVGSVISVPKLVDGVLGVGVNPGT